MHQNWKSGDHLVSNGKYNLLKIGLISYTLPGMEMGGMGQQYHSPIAAGNTWLICLRDTNAFSCTGKATGLVVSIIPTSMKNLMNISLTDKELFKRNNKFEKG